MIAALDHLVLATADERACVDFYVGVLGMELQTFGAGRKALRFGAQKINIHPPGSQIEPRARVPTPGSLDLCWLVSVPLEAVMARLREKGVAIVEGPVRRTGATGPIRSVYVRDPDGNLLELAEIASKEWLIG